MERDSTWQVLSVAGVAILGVAGAKVPAGEYTPERAIPTTDA